MSTTPTVKTLFDAACSHITVDRVFLRKLQTYRQNFANKNEEHIAFFGGHLMGVQDVKFTRTDQIEWFANILDIDDQGLQEDLLTLKTLVPDPKKVRYVSTNVMNLSCLWVCHAVYNSKLSEAEKKQGMLDALLVLQYKFITSILAHWFPNRADEAVAVATYARLPKKYKLKELGSWGALLHYRAEQTIDKRSPHVINNTIQSFDDDLDIVYMVNDIQGRIKGYLRNIRDEFEIVRRDPMSLIKTTSNTTINIDGEVVVKNKKNAYGAYRRYFGDVVSDRNSFIVSELVDIVAATMPKLPRKNMMECLEYITAKSSIVKGDPDVIKLADLTLEHLFDYIATNRNTINPKDIASLLSRLRNLYTASRASNDLLLQMRDVGERVVRRAVKTKNVALVASVRTSVLMYIVLRTITMQHYRKS